MIADHHNVVDTTMWDVFGVFLVIVCVGIGMMVKNLLDDEENGY